MGVVYSVDQRRSHLVQGVLTLRGIHAKSDKRGLQGKFAQLKTESLAAPGEAGTVSGPAYLQWRGNTYPVYGERQKVHIHAAEQLGPDLSRSEGTDGETAILEKISSALNEAKGLIRHALATSGGSSSRPSNQNSVT